MTILIGKTPLTPEFARTFQENLLLEIQCKKCTKVWLYSEGFNVLNEVIKDFRKHIKEHSKK